MQAVAVVKTLGKMEDELLKEKPASGGRTVYVREAAPASDSPDSADERDEMIAQLRENVELERSSSAWAEDEFLPAMQAASTATVRALSVEKSQRDEIIARLRQELTSGRYGASGEEDLGWSDWIKSVAQRVGIDLDAASTRGSLTGAVASVRGSVSETLAAVEKALGDVDLSGLTAEETGANFSADVVRRAVEGQEPGDALAAEVAREKAAGQAAFQAFASSVARESAASAATEAAEAQAQAQAAKQRLDRKDFAFAASTTLTAAAKPGATVLQVTSQGGFAVGDTIRIGEGTSAETNTIAGFGSIHLAVPVSGSHPAGTVVVCVSAEADEDSAPVYRSAGLILDAESAAVAAAPAAAPASSAPPEKVPRAFDLPPPPTPAAPGTALALDGESGAAFAAKVVREASAGEAPEMAFAPGAVDPSEAGAATDKVLKRSSSRRLEKAAEAAAAATAAAAAAAAAAIGSAVTRKSAGEIYREGDKPTWEEAGTVAAAPGSDPNAAFASKVVGEAIAGEPPQVAPSSSAEPVSDMPARSRKSAGLSLAIAPRLSGAAFAAAVTQEAIAGEAPKTPSKEAVQSNPPGKALDGLLARSPSRRSTSRKSSPKSAPVAVGPSYGEIFREISAQAEAQAEKAEAQTAAAPASASADDEKPTVVSSTKLSEPAKAGDTVLQVTSQDGFAVGDTIHIGEGASAETNTIAGFGSIHLATPLAGDHPKGTPIVCVGAEESSAPVYRSAAIVAEAPAETPAEEPAAEAGTAVDAVLARSSSRKVEKLAEAAAATVAAGVAAIDAKVPRKSAGEIYREGDKPTWEEAGTVAAAPGSDPNAAFASKVVGEAIAGEPPQVAPSSSAEPVSDMPARSRKSAGLSLAIAPRLSGAAFAAAVTQEAIAGEAPKTPSKEAVQSNPPGKALDGLLARSPSRRSTSRKSSPKSAPVAVGPSYGEIFREISAQAEAQAEKAEAQTAAAPASASADDEKPTVVSSTKLSEPAKAGDTVLQVTSQDGFAVGDTIHIGEGASAETNTIAGFGSIHLATPLAGDHPKGTPIVCVGAEESSAPVYRSAAIVAEAPAETPAEEPAAEAGTAVDAVLARSSSRKVEKLAEAAAATVAAGVAAIDAKVPRKSAGDQFRDIASRSKEEEVAGAALDGMLARVDSEPKPRKPAEKRTSFGPRGAYVDIYRASERESQQAASGRGVSLIESFPEDTGAAFADEVTAKAITGQLPREEFEAGASLVAENLPGVAVNTVLARSSSRKVEKLAEAAAATAAATVAALDAKVPRKSAGELYREAAGGSEEDEAGTAIDGVLARSSSRKAEKLAEAAAAKASAAAAAISAVVPRKSAGDQYRAAAGTEDEAAGAAIDGMLKRASSIKSPTPKPAAPKAPKPSRMSYGEQYRQAVGDIEVAEASGVPPPPLSTTLMEPAESGETVLQTSGQGGFAVGDVVRIGEGANAETHTIAGFGSIHLATPLSGSHPAGTTIVCVSAEDETTAPVYRSAALVADPPEAAVEEPAAVPAAEPEAPLKEEGATARLLTAAASVAGPATRASRGRSFDLPAPPAPEPSPAEPEAGEPSDAGTAVDAVLARSSSRKVERLAEAAAATAAAAVAALDAKVPRKSAGDVYRAASGGVKDDEVGDAVDGVLARSSSRKLEKVAEAATVTAAATVAALDAAVPRKSAGEVYRAAAGSSREEDEAAGAAIDGMMKRASSIKSPTPKPAPKPQKRSSSRVSYGEQYRASAGSSKDDDGPGAAVDGVLKRSSSRKVEQLAEAAAATASSAVAALDAAVPRKSAGDLYRAASGAPDAADDEEAGKAVDSVLARSSSRKLEKAAEAAAATASAAVAALESAIPRKSAGDQYREMAGSPAAEEDSPVATPPRRRSLFSRVVSIFSGGERRTL